jgi:hypothetical protein
MANDTMLKYAAKAIVKFVNENKALQVKIAQLETKERALGIAYKLAEAGTIEHSQILEKAAALAKEDLSVIEKAIDLNLSNVLSIGTAALQKEASVDGKQNAQQATKSFEEFLVNNFS